MALNRREFVKGAIVTAGCGCLASCASELAPAAPSGPVDVGSPTDFPREGHYDRWAKSHGFYLVREKGTLLAVSGDCTHKHCLVKPEKREWECPCHGSRFAQTGSLLEGPARKALPHLAIALNPAGRIIVDGRRSFDEPHWSEPGAFVQMA